jgi:hypothetical protein|tara:strand:- start:725 stop:1024 length:300 start_codon:yes stop_codon:yes gene_type:complete
MSTNSFDLVMAELKDMKKKMDADKRAMKAAAVQKRKDARLVAKEHNRLTKSVKKAGHQAPSSLDCNSVKNMYYSDRDTQAFIAGSSLMDSYNSVKSDWD